MHFAPQARLPVTTQHRQRIFLTARQPARMKCSRASKSLLRIRKSWRPILSCIESEEIVAIQALGDDEEAKEQRETMFEKKYNAAVDEQTRTVEQFNAEIRAFKAR